MGTLIHLLDSALSTGQHTGTVPPPLAASLTQATKALCLPAEEDRRRPHEGQKQRHTAKDEPPHRGQRVRERVHQEVIAGRVSARPQCGNELSVDECLGTRYPQTHPTPAESHAAYAMYRYSQGARWKVLKAAHEVEPAQPHGDTQQRVGGKERRL